MQSTDGRYVVFVSNSPNLVSSVTLPEGIQQVYRYDRVINEVLLVSIASDNATAGNGNSDYPTISGDGMRVAFTSYSTNLDPSDLNVDSDIYIRELDADPRTILASRNPQTSETSNRESSSLSISDNGEYVAFESLGSNLVPYDFNQVSDIFVYAVDESVTKVASRASPDRPSITPAGGAGFTAGLPST
ncbi:MAG: TolB family protein, partial [Planctomycetota bacterium]